MGSTLTFRDWLAALDTAQLEEVVASAPLARAGARVRDIDELAQRLAHPATVGQTISTAPLPVLETVEAIAALGESATPDAVTALLCGAEVADAESGVQRMLDAACTCALVWFDGHCYRVNPGVDDILIRPLAIDRPARTVCGEATSDQLAAMLRNLGGVVPTRKAERLEAVLAALGNRAVVRRVIASAPGTVLQDVEARVARRLARARCVLADDVFADEVPEDGDMFDSDAYRRERAADEWLERVGLGIANRYWGYGDAIDVPTEVFLALAPPDFTAPFHPDPPSVTTAIVSRAQVESGAAAALAGFLAATMAVLEQIGTAGVPALKRGGIGARELARLAKRIGEPPNVVRMAVELAVEIGLLVNTEQRTVACSPTFDAWRRRPPHERALDLVRCWMLLMYVPTSDRASSGASRAAGGNDMAATDMPNALLLADLVAAVAGDDSGDEAAAVTSPSDIAAAMSWYHPSAGDFAATVPLTWSEAHVLGALVDGAPSAFTRALVNADEDEAARLIRSALPNHSREVIFGSDLTAVAPGSPLPEVIDVLSAVAVREGHGVANTWRIDRDSIRGALDTGYTVDELTGALRGLAGGQLPQTWEYLLADTGRIYGRTVVRPAGAVLTAADTDLLAEVVAARSLHRLGLSVVAPTVAISPRSVAETLASLRAAGYLPAEADIDGARVVRIERPPLPMLGEPTDHDRPQYSAETQDGGDEAGKDGAVTVDDDATTMDDGVIAQDGDTDTPDGTATRANPLAPRPGAESAAELAARLTSGEPYDPWVHEPVRDLAEVEAHIRRHNRRLSDAEVHELADAEAAIRPVTIRYRSQSGAETIRLVSQLDIVGDNLFCYCHLREADRYFRLDRVIGVVPVL